MLVDQRDTVAGLVDDSSCEYAAVGRRGNVADVPRLNRPIGIQNGDEQRLGRTIGQRPQIGTDVVSQSAQLMTGRTLFPKDGLAALLIALHGECFAVSFDNLEPIGVSRHLKGRDRLPACFWRLVRQQKLALDGAERGRRNVLRRNMIQQKRRPL